MLRFDNLRPDRALKWKVEDRQLGGEWDVESQHLQGCSLRLCRLSTDGLALVSKYWTYWSYDGDMDLASLVACSSTDVWLKSVVSMVVFGRETKAGPVGH
jgi:hypothetical protein